MDDKDYLLLIAQLTDRLRETGAAELARADDYVETNAETGESRLLAPQQRLVAMLAAFERHLAVRDQATFLDAMARMKDATSGRVPERVIVVFAGEDGERAWVDLSDAPDLSGPRAELQNLIELMGESDLEPA